MEEDESMMAVLPPHELTDQIASALHTPAPTSTYSHAEEEEDVTKNVNEVVSPLHSTTSSEDKESVMSSKEHASSILSSIGTGPVHSVTEKKQESVSKKPVAKLMTIEERGEGAVGWGVYQSYFQAANKPLLLVCLLLSFVLGTTEHYHLYCTSVSFEYQHGFKFKSCDFHHVANLSTAFKGYIILPIHPFSLGNTSQIFQQWIVAAWTSDVGYVKR
jgi:hypothetical protein